MAINKKSISNIDDSSLERELVSDLDGRDLSLYDALVQANPNGRYHNGYEVFYVDDEDDMYQLSKDLQKISSSKGLLIVFQTGSKDAAANFYDSATEYIRKDKKYFVFQ